MNELALITWVCSAPRAAVSHWWQLCFALASLMDSRQRRECAVAACVRTRRGSHSPALKKDGHGREGLAEVGRGVRVGSTCHTCLPTGDPLHAPSPYPRQLHARQLLPALWHPGPCDVGARRSRRFRDKNIPTRAFTGSRRKAAALCITLGLYLERCRTTSSVEAAYLPAVSTPV